MDGGRGSFVAVKNSTLSPTVKKLISEVGRGITSAFVVHSGHSHLDKEGEDNFEKEDHVCRSKSCSRSILPMKNGIIGIDECIKHSFDTVKELPWTSEDYQKAVFHCSPIFKHCQDFLASKQCEEFSDIYKEHYQWTKNVKLFLDAFRLLSLNESDKDLLALLVICGGIEHALGNIYLLRGQQCPTMLKELLSTKELEDMLGEAAIKILHIIIGPPISMNLRNIAWHGFFSVGELPNRYIYFLLVLTASLSESLLLKGIHFSSITDRPYYSLSKADLVAKQCPDINDCSLKKIEQCILNSWFSQESNRAFLQGIFDLYRENKYGFSCALALPQLEHILRQLFVSVNNCPARLVTAEASTLFTTFEEILNSCLPDGLENRLLTVLGEPFLDLLHDVLVYPNGPRARDKLSHGEADYYDVPPSAISVIVTAMAFIALKTCDAAIDDPVLIDLKDSVERYESLFHPLTMLKGKVIELSHSLCPFQESLNTSPDLNSWDRESGYQVFTEDNVLFQEVSHHLITFIENLHECPTRIPGLDALKVKLMEPFSTIDDYVVKLLSEKRISTLHRWQKSAKLSASDVTESEIVSLLLRTTEEAIISVNQSQETLQLRQQQLNAKSLRSRQRENLKRLLLFLPTLNLMTKYVVILSLSIFHFLENRSKQDPKNLKLMQRFLKNNLQVTENLRTFTANDKNKWIQSEEIIMSAVESGIKFAKLWQKDS